MLKWSYLAAALGWAASMVYEWMWYGGPIVQYIAWAMLGITVLGGLFIRALGPGKRGRKEPRAMIWFLLAALVCALFYSAVDRVYQIQPPHIRLLPMYLILFLDFFASGCYTWWKKLKGRNL